MKQILWMITLVALVGCGKKEPIQPSATNSTTPSWLGEAKASAEAGDAAAQSALGGLYWIGEDVEQDSKEAAKWFRKAADQGDSSAQSNLGATYGRGDGVEQDFKEAVKWYQKAAGQGFAGAQAELGMIYYIGEGVGANNVTAYAWLNIAATNGEENAKKGKSGVAKKMIPAQIAKAEELVKEMVKKNPKLLNKK